VILIALLLLFATPAFAVNLQTTEYNVIVSNGTVTGIAQCEVRGTASPGIETNPAANEFDPDPTYGLDWLVQGPNDIDAVEAGVDTLQNDWSPNPDGGETGSDTAKGQGFIFTPAGDRPAVEAHLVFTGTGEGWATQGGWFPLQWGLWGAKLPNVPLWPLSHSSGTVGGDAYP